MEQKIPRLFPESGGKNSQENGGYYNRGTNSCLNNV